MSRELLKHLMSMKDGEEVRFRRDNMKRWLEITKLVGKTKTVDRVVSDKELHVSRDPEGLLIYNLEFMDEQLRHLDRPQQSGLYLFPNTPRSTWPAAVERCRANGDEYAAKWWEEKIAKWDELQRQHDSKVAIMEEPQ